MKYFAWDDAKNAKVTQERGIGSRMWCATSNAASGSYAKATFRKDRRLNIRFLSKDLEAIQKRGLAEG